MIIGARETENCRYNFELGIGWKNNAQNRQRAFKMERRRLILRTRIYLMRIASELRRCPAPVRYIGLFYIITFVLILPWFHVGNPYSIYKYPFWTREEISQTVLNQNRKRLSGARAYISGLERQSTLKKYREYLENGHLDVVIAVVTVKRLYGREDVGYLTQTVARFDELFRKDTSFPRKAFFICNVHAGPGNHSEANWLSGYFPTVTRFPQLDTASVIMDVFEKEKQDYSYCLQQSLMYRSKYVLMVEDDALPLSELFKTLNYTLDNYMEYKWQRGRRVRRSTQWAYLKLFYPLKWQGFGSNIAHCLEILSVGAVGGSIFVLIGNAWICRRRTKFQRHAMTHVLWFACGAMYAVLTALAVGRQSVIELRRLCPLFYNVVMAPDCCSPGILYPASVIHRIVQYLQTIRCRDNFGVDIALDEYVTNERYDKFLIEPNLFDHIGYVSTIKGPSLNPALYLDFRL